MTEKTYVPDGYTALLDAVGRTISTLGQRLAKMPEAERPEKVIFVIQTDGQENHSKEYSYLQVCEMIRHQRDKYAWEFLFLGADENTIQVASDMGIPQGAAMQYAASPSGVDRVFGTVAAAVSDRRRGLRSRDAVFSAEERQANRGGDNGCTGRATEAEATISTRNARRIRQLPGKARLTCQLAPLSRTGQACPAALSSRREATG